MPTPSLHAILRLPRSRRPAAAREWLKQEEARFPDSKDEEPSPLPEGTGRHPLDLILNLLPHQRPPAVRAWVEQEEPAAEAEMEQEARAAGSAECILRFPTAWTRYSDFQPPSEPWIELLRDGRRLYHAPSGTTSLIPEPSPEPEPEPDASTPAITLTAQAEEHPSENTVAVTEAPSENVAGEDPVPPSAANRSPISRFPRSVSGPVIDESPPPGNNLVHRRTPRGPTLRGPPFAALCASVPVPSLPSQPSPARRRRDPQGGSCSLTDPNRNRSSQRAPACGHQGR